MFNLLIYKKIYHNNLELNEIYTIHSKQVHNTYRFMYHYIYKLRINQSYFPVFPAYLPTLEISDIQGHDMSSHMRYSKLQMIEILAESVLDFSSLISLSPVY